MSVDEWTRDHVPCVCRPPSNSFQSTRSPYMFLTGWVIVLAVLLFWAVGAYNRLVRLRSSVIQSFGTLDAELQRRASLLGEYDAAVTGPRMPEDAQVHEALRASSTQFTASLAVMRARPLDASASAALAAAAKVLDAAWQKLIEAGQSAAEDHSVAALNSLIERSAQQHAQIEHATTQFNIAVDQYNGAVAQFPANVLAWVFGFKQTRTL